MDSVVLPPGLCHWGVSFPEYTCELTVYCDAVVLHNVCRLPYML
jgi:hypothetical protein